MTSFPAGVRLFVYSAPRADRLHRNADVLPAQISSGVPGSTLPLRGYRQQLTARAGQLQKNPIVSKSDVISMADKLFRNRRASRLSSDFRYSFSQSRFVGTSRSRRSSQKDCIRTCSRGGSKRSAGTYSPIESPPKTRAA